MINASIHRLIFMILMAWNLNPRVVHAHDHINEVQFAEQWMKKYEQEVVSIPSIFHLLLLMKNKSTFGKSLRIVHPSDPSSRFMPVRVISPVDALLTTIVNQQSPNDIVLPKVGDNRFPQQVKLFHQITQANVLAMIDDDAQSAELVFYDPSLDRMDLVTTDNIPDQSVILDQGAWLEAVTGMGGRILELYHQYVLVQNLSHVSDDDRDQQAYWMDRRDKSLFKADKRRSHRKSKRLEWIARRGYLSVYRYKKHRRENPRPNDLIVFAAHESQP